MIRFLMKRTLEAKLQREYQDEMATNAMPVNERALLYSVALRLLAERRAATVLNVGAGESPFGAVLASCGYKTTDTDQKGPYWGNSYFNRHHYVMADDICHSTFPAASFDAVLCLGTLQHISDPGVAVKEMTRLLKEDGLLVVNSHYSWDEYCPNVYARGDADPLSRTFRYPAKSLSDREIDEVFSGGTLREIERCYYRGWDGKFWRSGKRLPFPEIVTDKTSANGIILALLKKTA